MDEELQEMMNKIDKDEARELNKLDFWQILKNPSLYWDVLFFLQRLYMCK